jgi:diaminopimelate decarboxylase
MSAGIYALEKFPNAKVLNLGGGFKLGYMKGEKGANLPAIGNIARQKLSEFYRKTGRKIKLEIEPGRYLTARAGSIISTIIDKTDTGKHGDIFLRLDTGMTEIVRTAMYGSLHPLIVINKDTKSKRGIKKYVVIGHCCESSDLLTPSKNNPEKIDPRFLNSAEIGDYMVIEMAGAYCASMSVKGYNSFPEAKEIIAP